MDSATSGLIGAGIGAAASILGAIFAQAFQSRREHQRWVLARKEEAYSNSNARSWHRSKDGLCLDMEKFWPLNTFDALCLTSFQCFQAFLLNKAHQD